MRGAKAFAAGIALVLAMTVPAFGAGEIGDPPTSGFATCDPGLRPCTDPVILATGSHGRERIEIWGMGTRQGLCHGVDTLRGQSSSGFYGCGGHGRPPHGKALKIHSLEGRTGGHGSTQIYGTVRRDVRRVTIRYARGQTVRHTGTNLNQVRAPLAGRIDEQPFGVFEASVQGCLNPNRVNVVAFDQ